MKVIKGIKLRLYPNKKQTNQLWQRIEMINTQLVQYRDFIKKF